MMKSARDTINFAVRILLLTWDPSASRFWLIDEYFPEIEEIDRRIFPTIEDYGRELGHTSVIDVPVPHDCTDGFLGAYWRRPEAYLDANLRSAISVFSRIDATAGLEALGRDLASGAWKKAHANLLTRDELDLGYRLLTWDIA